MYLISRCGKLTGNLTNTYEQHGKRWFCGVTEDGVEFMGTTVTLTVVCTIEEYEALETGRIKRLLGGNYAQLQFGTRITRKSQDATSPSG